MSKVTSYWLLVIGWSSEHCVTLLRLQTFLYKYNFIKMWDVHQLPFLSSTLENISSGRENTGTGAMAPGRERKCPHCRAFLSHWPQRLLTPPRFKTGFLRRQIPLKVPRRLHVNSSIFTVKSVSSEAARALVLGNVTSCAIDSLSNWALFPASARCHYPAS